MRLTPEEIVKATDDEKDRMKEFGYEAGWKGWALAIAQAQLKKVVKELEERAEIQHEHCSADCAHRGVEIFFDIYDWQDLLKEIE